jgi:hypothetical protein
METKTTERKTKFTHYASQTLFYIGSTVALIVGTIQVMDWWKNREPKLDLFLPEYFTGKSESVNTRILNMLVQISNSSTKNAYILPITISVEIKKNGIWYKMEMLWADRDYMEPVDLPNKTSFGTNEVLTLKRFENLVITYDNPISRYVTVTHKDESILENPTDIRIEVEDCHKKFYKMEVNLVEQQSKHDPEYRHKN